jgi:hypothetical protein
MTIKTPTHEQAQPSVIRWLPTKHKSKKEKENAKGNEEKRFFQRANTAGQGAGRQKRQLHASRHRPFINRRVVCLRSYTQS